MTSKTPTPEDIADDCVEQAFANGECSDDPNMNAVRTAIANAIRAERESNTSFPSDASKIEKLRQLVRQAPDSYYSDEDRLWLAEFDGDKEAVEFWSQALAADDKETK